MNYFELYQIPVSLQPDKAELRKKFLQLSRQHHPDYFANGTATEQEDALENSAQVNKAFKVLSQPEELLKYVLTLKGLLQTDEKYALPPAFLMDMMEINEQLAEVNDADEREAVMKQIKQIEKEIYEPVEKIIETYQEDITSAEALLQVKEYYFKKKYLNRLREQLGGML